MSMKTVFFMGALAVMLAACGSPKEVDHQALVEDKPDTMLEEEGHSDHSDDLDAPDDHHDNHSDNRDEHDAHSEGHDDHHDDRSDIHDDHDAHSEDHDDHHENHDVDHSDENSHAIHGEHDDHEDEDTHTALDAHEHGSAVAAVFVEGNSIEVEIFSPLANFGFAESGDAVPSSSEFADFVFDKESVVATTGGQCVKSMKGMVIESKGHAEGQIVISFVCSSMPTKLEFTLLKAFEDGFKELDVVMLSDYGQKSTVLTSKLRVLELR